MSSPPGPGGAALGEHLEALVRGRHHPLDLAFGDDPAWETSEQLERKLVIALHLDDRLPVALREAGDVPEPRAQRTGRLDPDACKIGVQYADGKARDRAKWQGRWVKGRMESANTYHKGWFIPPAHQQAHFAFQCHEQNA